MNFLSALRKSFSAKQVTEESSFQPSRLQIESLEERCMLSAAPGIFFNAELGQVVVRGGEANDVGSFEFIDDGTVRANLSGVESQDFALESVNRIVFVGRDGDDTFSNNTFFESFQIGGDGNDTLNGGSGVDRLSGGNGNDILDGDSGDDIMLGLAGSDEMYGGDGNDQMYGGSGLNFIYGEDGNDKINGGASVDVIEGGAGIDDISGFAGDDIIDTGDGGIVDDGDIARGHGGNDTFYGGNGVNIFYGGAGNDEMYGGVDAANFMYGQNGDDMMTGGELTDTMFGNRGDDTLLGNGGTDFLKGGFDDDTIDGGEDDDFIVYGGNEADYTVETIGSNLEVTHLGTAPVGTVDGVDNVAGAETLRFVDEDVEVVTSEIIEVVTIQPIIASNDDGSNTAGFFGTAEQTEIIMDRIDEIFLVAGVDVEWLTANTWNSSFANVGDEDPADPRPGSDLSAILEEGESAGVASSDPLVLNMYFVEISPFFSQTSNFTANGFARVGGNGSTVHIGDSLTTFEGGQDVAARVTAHELAHNLGLFHVNDPGNLMANGAELNASQITTILESEYTVPIVDVIVL